MPDGLRSAGVGNDEPSPSGEDPRHACQVFRLTIPYRWCTVFGDAFALRDRQTRGPTMWFKQRCMRLLPCSTAPEPCDYYLAAQWQIPRETAEEKWQIERIIRPLENITRVMNLTYTTYHECIVLLVSYDSTYGPVIIDAHGSPLTVQCIDDHWHVNGGAAAMEAVYTFHRKHAPAKEADLSYFEWRQCRDEWRPPTFPERPLPLTRNGITPPTTRHTDTPAADVNAHHIDATTESEVH